MKFLDFLQNNIVCLDGGLGTLLQAQGMRPGEHPEHWNLSHPEAVISIHQAYYEAGSHVVCANTFGANVLKFPEEELESIIREALENAKEARARASGERERFVALDIGPSGKLLKPLGDLDFEDAVEVFAKTVRLGAKYGADLIFIETMNDSYEAKAALLAAKENSDLPVIVSNAYSDDGKLMTGATPAAMVALLESMGADAVGANCSLGLKQLRGVVEQLLENASVPVMLKPNAGLPQSVDGRTVFDVEADEFSDEVLSLIKKGVRIVGGCCGTTPDYIRALCEKFEGLNPVPVQPKNLAVVSSYTHAVQFGGELVLIGERINPTGKKRMQQALQQNNLDYLLTEGVNQQEQGVQMLDVNVVLPEVDEISMLKTAVCELQAVLDLPLQIDTTNPVALEAALRRYNGKAMINSVSGKPESMRAVFPLVKKYGGLVVALTLDENGIPETAEDRVAIAEKILNTAAEYGLSKKDLIFDPLTMAISADTGSAQVTLEALRLIRDRLGCNTLLGISNVSYGLPHRDALNSVFFALALENGLSAAIMNPDSAEMMKTWCAYRALKGLDANCETYLGAAARFSSAEEPATRSDEAQKSTEEVKSELQHAILKGFKEKAAAVTKILLESLPPLEIVNHEILPALNIMGEGFERKTVYLPQLLMSAEATKSAFEVIKEAMADEPKGPEKGTVVVATVHGDIHDIGKNIVRLLLENYGFHVVDLGKDVPPEAVLEKVLELHAPVAGLSALMTTTVPAMEETIRLIHEKAPWCQTIVGGAVLTPDYADRIKADLYARDAMETVRLVEKITEKAALA